VYFPLLFDGKYTQSFVSSRRLRRFSLLSRRVGWMECVGGMDGMRGWGGCAAQVGWATRGAGALRKSGGLLAGRVRYSGVLTGVVEPTCEASEAAEPAGAEAGAWARPWRGPRRIRVPQTIAPNRKIPATHQNATM
jgi:hypothetical protein